MTTALCASEDPEIWFPEPGRRTRRAKAIAICGQCPLRLSCLQHALDNNIADGIWGGLTPGERRALRRPRTPVPASEGDSEIRGVSWNAHKGRWVVVIRHGGRIHSVGRYREREAAEAAAIAKCKELDTSTVRSRSGKKAA